MKDECLYYKEENLMNENKKEIVENPEPDWGLMMFWEDITAFFQKLGEIIESIIKAITGE